MSNISIHYQNVLHSIQLSLKKSSRDVDSVKLLAVTKGQSTESILELARLGQTCFSENYVQEWKEKKETLQTVSLDSPIQWHFTGRIQTNKVKYLIGEIELFHSIDRLELAEKMNQVSKTRNMICRGLIELNLGDEQSKAGIHIGNIEKVFDQLNQYENLSIPGLMILPPYFEDPELSRPYFKQLREILFDLNRRNLYREELTELSMGTSHDFPIAIEEGATWVRVGRTLFR